jgi:23S rRNA pseudouridine2605 synthase
MKTRLAKFIADSGVASRREAERLIENGAVFVNGEKITTPVFFVEGPDKVVVSGKQIENRKSKIENRVFAFHKPINTITSTSDPQGRTTIYDVMKHKSLNINHKLAYIGRLDYKTTGLLLLTGDGDLSRALTLPNNKIERVYVATLHPKKFQDIKNPAPANALRKFLSPISADDNIFDSARRGMTIDKIKYAPMKIEVLSRYPLSVRLSLAEGKKNEIRVVMDALGFMVKKLNRESFGPISLGKLAPGELRELSEKEIDLLRKSF